MKVACIGNMNNMLFSLVRFLRDRGVEADLLMQPDELKHFRPVNDTFGDQYKSYTRHLTWGAGDARMFRDTTKKRIREDVKQYDFLIVSGVALAYLHKAGIKVDIFFPHGTDIKYLPFKGEKMRLDQRLRNYYSYQLFENQKKGIQNASVVNIEHSDPFWDEPIEKLRIRPSTVYFGCPMVYQPQYNRELIQKYYQFSSNYTRYSRIRNECDLLIVNQARQLWVSYAKIGHPNKGSDKLIKGFANFMAESKTKAKLVLFEYGEDVDASKKLISDLGIEDHIIWEPLTSRKEIMVLLSMADFACGEFDPGDIGGGSTWEALASGSCLLHYLNKNFTRFDKFFTSPYPFVNVKEPEEIKETFKDFLTNPEHYRSIGRDGADWYRANFSERSVNSYLALINGKNKNENPVEVLSQI